jgi:ribosomal protein S18 acetylase RimI-like enzyme
VLTTIRLATSEDAELIARISQETFIHSFAAFNTPENMNKFMEGQFSRENLMAEVTAPGSTFLLAFTDAVIAGYVRLREAPNPPALGNKRTIEIARIYMAAHSIGKGVGSLLMQECIQIAKDSKIETIWLGVWEHNPRAIAFYERVGFEKFSEHVFMLGDDPQTDWLMKKEL